MKKGLLAMMVSALALILAATVGFAQEDDEAVNPNDEVYEEAEREMENEGKKTGAASTKTQGEFLRIIKPIDFGMEHLVKSPPKKIVTQGSADGEMLRSWSDDLEGMAKGQAKNRCALMGDLDTANRNRNKAGLLNLAQECRELAGAIAAKHDYLTDPYQDEDKEYVLNVYEYTWSYFSKEIKELVALTDGVDKNRNNLELMKTMLPLMEEKARELNGVIQNFEETYLARLSKRHELRKGPVRSSSNRKQNLEVDVEAIKIPESMFRKSPAE